MGKQCFECEFYRAYYTKGYCNFTKQDCGECKIDRTKTNKHNSGCEKFMRARHSHLNNGLVLRKTNQISEELKTLITFLQEKYERDAD